MFRRIGLSLISATVALAFGGAVAMADTTSGTPGQPNQSCGTDGATTFVPGFDTTGFNDATLVYAATDGTHSAIAGNPMTVSQYDVACFQFTQSGH